MIPHQENACIKGSTHARTVPKPFPTTFADRVGCGEFHGMDGVGRNGMGWDGTEYQKFS